MNPDDNDSVPGPSTPRLPAGAKLGLVALVVLLAAAVGVVVLFDASTDPGFRTSAMEKSVRAGLPSGWKMKVTEADEHSGPCIDGCDGSHLDVDLTASDPHASRAAQQRELGAAMDAGGWRYSAPTTRAQALAAYQQAYPADLGETPVDADDATIGFDPQDAGLFEGGPQSRGSTVSYSMTARWFDGQLSLQLSATQGE